MGGAPAKPIIFINAIDGYRFAPPIYALEVSGGTGGHGLLSLCFLSFVVRRACKRLQPLEQEAVRITSGAEHVATLQKTEFGQHQYCAKCGGHLMTDHPPFGLVDVFAATLPTLKFTRGVHVVYTSITPRQ